MSLFYIHNPINNELEEVGRDAPLPVIIQDAAVVYTRYPVVATCTAVTNAGAYDASDNVGGVMKLPYVLDGPRRMGYLKNVTIIDKNNQKAQLEAIVFQYQPTAGTYTDDANITLGTDARFIVARIPIAAADYATIGVGDTPDVAIGYVNLNDRPVVGDANGTLWIVVMCVATPTYASTADLDFIWGIDKMI